MKIKFLSLIILMMLLNTCSSLKEANKILRNEKVRTTDEFLIEKREPLVFPPDYEKMPEPNKNNKTKTNEQEKIKELFNKSKEENIISNKSSSVEDTILNKIKK